MFVRRKRRKFAQGVAILLPRLWRFGLTLSGSPDAADELVQATCVRALEREDQFQEGTRLDSWMFSILSSIWKNQLRAERIRRGEGFVDAAEVFVVDGQKDAESKIFLRQVLDEVQRLPEAQRVAVLLVYVEGCKYREAAEILDIPVETVMSRLAAARETLGKLAIDKTQARL
jgi:RNA polymerase sigma-70 factor (ECF subfamily)